MIWILNNGSITATTTLLQKPHRFLLGICELIATQNNNNNNNKNNNNNNNNNNTNIIISG